MKSRRHVFAVVALLALLNAGPAAADWNLPTGGIAPPDLEIEGVALVAHWGFQILQVAL